MAADFGNNIIVSSFDKNNVSRQKGNGFIFLPAIFHYICIRKSYPHRQSDADHSKLNGCQVITRKRCNSSNSLDFNEVYSLYRFTKKFRSIKHFLFIFPIFFAQMTTAVLRREEYRCRPCRRFGPLFPLETGAHGRNPRLAAHLEECRAFVQFAADCQRLPVAALLQEMDVEPHGGRRRDELQWQHVAHHLDVAHRVDVAVEVDVAVDEAGAQAPRRRHRTGLSGLFRRGRGRGARPETGPQKENV